MQVNAALETIQIYQKEKFQYISEMRKAQEESKAVIKDCENKIEK